MDEFDDLDQLKLQGLIRHAQAEGHANAQQAQLKEVRRELRRLRTEDDWQRALPQCPVCGGRIETQFRKCKHCSSELAWVGGVPCEPKDERDLRERLENKKAKELAEKQKQQAELEASRRPCAKCRALTYAKDLSRNSRCRLCVQELEKQVAAVTWTICGVGALIGGAVGFAIQYAVFPAAPDEFAYFVLLLVFVGSSGFLGFIAALFIAEPIVRSVLEETSRSTNSHSEFHAGTAKLDGRSGAEEWEREEKGAREAEKELRKLWLSKQTASYNRFVSGGLLAIRNALDESIGRLVAVLVIVAVNVVALTILLITMGAISLAVIPMEFLGIVAIAALWVPTDQRLRLVLANAERMLSECEQSRVIYETHLSSVANRLHADPKEEPRKREN